LGLLAGLLALRTIPFTGRSLPVFPLSMVERGTGGEDSRVLGERE
jgi:hypothetical protein